MATKDIVKKQVKKGQKGFKSLSPVPLTKQLNIRLSESAIEKLNKFAEANKINKTVWARAVLEKAIAEL